MNEIITTFVEIPVDPVFWVLIGVLALVLIVFLFAIGLKMGYRKALKNYRNYQDTFLKEVKELENDFWSDRI